MTNEQEQYLNGLIDRCHEGKGEIIQQHETESLHNNKVLLIKAVLPRGKTINIYVDENGKHMTISDDYYNELIS